MAISETKSRPDAPLDPGPASRERGARRIEGRARLDRRTKRLLERLSPGHVAVIDHPELDRLSAEGLVRSGVRCVINCSASSSQRYPNQGPALLVEAGVHLVDAPGADLLERLDDGDEVAVEGGEVTCEGRLLASGRVLDRGSVKAALEKARAELDSTLEIFSANTVAHLRAERDLLGAPLAVPRLRTPFAGRAALVVARGPGAVEDLRGLSAFARTERPVLVGVDGGADALIETGFRPEVVVGDMDSASDAALRGGAELVVHAYPDGEAPGAARLLSLGLGHELLALPGTSEDAALLLSAELGARPIVTVGYGSSLVDFLDRGRSGMASTFLTRLRLGELLVDGRGVATLLRS